MSTVQETAVRDDVAQTQAAVTAASETRKALNISRAASLIALILMIAAPLFVRNFVVFQFTQIIIYGIAIMSLNILTGASGQFSLGHSAFFAVGAYTTAILMEHGDMNYLLTLPFSGAVCFIFGFLFGLPALRLSGVYLALATFSLAIAMPQFLKLGTFESRESKLRALDRMRKYASYRRKNPVEADFFEYVGRWYHLAIREMARLPEFKADPEWIRPRLKVKVPTPVIRRALEFLLEHGYLQTGPDGTTTTSKETLKVESEVFKGAMIQFHKQMFGLATESMDNSTGAERNILGYTFALGPESYSRAKKIIDQALSDLVELEQSTADKETIYQVELALFPLTRRSDS